MTKMKIIGASERSPPPGAEEGACRSWIIGRSYRSRETGNGKRETAERAFLVRFPFYVLRLRKHRRPLARRHSLSGRLGSLPETEEVLPEHAAHLFLRVAAPQELLDHDREPRDVLQADRGVLDAIVVRPQSGGPRPA